MTPTSAQAAGTLLPHGGTFNSSNTPFLLDKGTGAVTACIILLAIVGTLGFIIAISVLIIRRHPKSLPLPPIQPLAYYRGKESGFSPRPHRPCESMEFNQDGHNRSEEASLQPLRIPNFRSIDSSTPSSSSIHRSASGSFATEQYISSNQLSRSSSLSASSRSRHDLSRKRSMTSTTTTSARVSTRSGNTIRGAPHFSCNNIEIVLPTPLAPQLQNHITKNPSAIQSDGQWPERGTRSPMSDRWMAGLIKTTYWPSNTEWHLSVGDTPPGPPCRLASGCQDHHGQLRRSESQPRSRGRSPAQPPRPGGPTRATSRVLHNRQATQPPSDNRNRRPTRSKLRPRSCYRPSPRDHLSLSNTSDLPFPRSALGSRRGCTPPWDEIPPPPVPPLPQLYRVLVPELELRPSQELVKLNC